MDKNIIDKYREEMLNLYAKNRVVPAVNTTVPPANTAENTASSGYLVGIVSAFRNIYPVPNAKVTVFKGDYNDMNIIDTAVTDMSGRTKIFTLETPLKALSQQADSSVIPYSTYNMLVEAEGYLDNIHLNIPVFSGVTSLQRSSMTLLETAGEDKGPQIFDEGQKYNL